jgi:trk system potassium uptake protein TrkH
MLAVVGGCTGSTTGGIKIFRYQVLYETAKSQINQLIQPHGIFRPTYNRRPISPTATASVMSFVILFAFCFAVLAVLLSFTGMDFISSMSGAGAMMANLGPALGDVIGPTGNYSSLTDGAKWLLSLGMLIGRLEIFTVLILFSPYFWRH